jgi:hypothetical protein
MENVAGRRPVWHFVFSGASSGNWGGLKPKALHCIYTIVVSLISSYATLVWWPRIKLETSIAKLRKLQRMSYSGATGALSIVLHQLQLKCCWGSLL